LKIGYFRMYAGWHGARFSQVGVSAAGNISGFYVAIGGGFDWYD